MLHYARMKVVVVWCVVGLVALTGCAVAAEDSLQTQESHAILDNVVSEVCVKGVLQAAEDAAQVDKISDKIVGDQLNSVLPDYDIESTVINGEFRSVESQVDPMIDLKMEETRSGSFWTQIAYSRPRISGVANRLGRMFFKSTLLDMVGRECTPIRDVVGEIVATSISNDVSVDQYRSRLCAAKHEPNTPSVPVILNGAQPLTDDPDGPQSIGLDSSMSDAADVDVFSVYIRDVLTIPYSGEKPTITIEVTDENGGPAPISSIGAQIDCGGKEPRMICPDGTSNATCVTTDSTLEVDLNCFVFKGDARLNVELTAASSVAACTPYQLGITVQ